MRRTYIPDLTLLGAGLAALLFWAAPERFCAWRAEKTDEATPSAPADEPGCGPRTAEGCGSDGAAPPAGETPPDGEQPDPPRLVDLIPNLALPRSIAVPPREQRDSAATSVAVAAGGDGTVSFLSTSPPPPTDDPPVWVRICFESRCDGSLRPVAGTFDDGSGAAACHPLLTSISRTGPPHEHC